MLTLPDLNPKERKLVAYGELLIGIALSSVLLWVLLPSLVRS